jgi:hypothetical protein
MLKKNGRASGDFLFGGDFVACMVSPDIRFRQLQTDPVDGSAEKDPKYTL